MGDATERISIVDSLRRAGSDVPGAEALLSHLTRMPPAGDPVESTTTRDSLVTIYRRRLRHVRANGFPVSRFVGLDELVEALERSDAEELLLDVVSGKSYSATIVRRLDGSFIGCVHGRTQPPLTP